MDAPVKDGQISGVEGERMEAIKITPPDGVVLDVKLHIQGKGWETYRGVSRGVYDPVMGTEGESKRVEAIEIVPVKNTTGKTLYYSVYAHEKGWLGKIKGGYASGSTGLGLQLEMIKMWLE